jgi:hypothetical protein
VLAESVQDSHFMIGRNDVSTVVSEFFVKS